MSPIVQSALIGALTSVHIVLLNYLIARKVAHYTARDVAAEVARETAKREVEEKLREIGGKQ